MDREDTREGFCQQRAQKRTVGTFFLIRCVGCGNALFRIGYTPQASPSSALNRPGNAPAGFLRYLGRGDSEGDAVWPQPVVGNSSEAVPHDMLHLSQGFLETMPVHVIGFGTSPPIDTLKTLDTSAMSFFLI
jgi:hypothetical protein